MAIYTIFKKRFLIPLANKPHGVQLNAALFHKLQCVMGMRSGSPNIKLTLKLHIFLLGPTANKQRCMQKKNYPKVYVHLRKTKLLGNKCPKYSIM